MTVHLETDHSNALATLPVRAPAVEARRISRRFGPTMALDNVSLSVAPGETRALVGRNGAGKSTLVSIISGLDAPSSGELRFDGERAPASSDYSAWRERVTCVYQHSKLAGNLTVAENLFLNRQPAHRSVIAWRDMRRQARQLLDEWEVGVSVEAVVRDLSVGERQAVEIARSLSLGTKLVLLDEPTAELESAGVKRLFDQVRRMQSRGVSFLFISHYLDEIFEVSHTVTVLRDGRVAMDTPIEDVSKQQVVEAMVGDKSILTTHDRPAVEPGAPPRVVIEDLCLVEGRHPVQLEVRPGECIGVAGLAASGKFELAETLAGLREPATGRVVIDGRPLAKGVTAAISAGVAYVPPDRHREGYVPRLGVADNITLPVLKNVSRSGWLSLRRRDEMAADLARDLELVSASLAQPVGELSGGNQQKVVMGRALSSRPTVLVLVHPTSGIDIASKAVLFAAVERALADGAAILVVSDELEELAMCDRTVVLFDGEVVGEFPAGCDDRELVAAIEGVSE